MWVSPEILNWFSRNAGSYYNTEDECRKAYEIWKHAENILLNQNNKLHLIDAVCALKRAMSHRLGILNNLYHFNNIPLPQKPKRIIEQLAFLGIIRPLMLKKLIDIRNLVEHANADPPDIDTCFEFLDIIWYFLRTTDRLVHLVADSIELCDAYNYDNINYSISLDIDVLSSWCISGSGWLPFSFVSFDKIDNWIEVQTTSVTRWKDSKLKEIDKTIIRNDEDLGFTSDMIIISGDHKRKIYELYFLSI